MTFTDIPVGTAVFLDVNTLVYAIVADPTFGVACKQLLDRVEQQHLQGFSSSHALSDMAHRLMTIEACNRLAWPVQGIANRLRRHPNEVRQLVSPRQALDEVSAAHVQVLPVHFQQVSQGVDISRQFGLMSGDALIVAVMRDHGLSQLASNDSDFDRVPGLTRYAPI